MKILRYAVFATTLIASGIVQAGDAGGCGERFLAQFKKADSQWQAVGRSVPRESADSRVAVTSLMSRRGKVWARTYASDYFPAKAKLTDDGLVGLTGLMFRTAPADFHGDPAADFVRPYNVAGVEFFVQADCAVEDRIKLLVFMKGRHGDAAPDEVIEFKRD